MAAAAGENLHDGGAAAAQAAGIVVRLQITHLDTDAQATAQVGERAFEQGRLA